MKILIRSVFLIFFGIVYCFQCLGDEIQKELENLRNRLKVPGINLAIAMPDGFISTYSTGYSDLEKKIPMGSETVMFSGSIGKTWVSALVLKMVSEGKIGLDDKVSRYLGGNRWFNRLQNSRSITVRMLMNHTSGISEHIMENNFNKSLLKSPDKIWKPAELVSFVLDKKPLFEGGKGWSYADTNYILLGMVIEKIEKSSYNRLLEARLLKPFKLKETKPSESRLIKNLAQGYTGKEPFGFPFKVVVGGRYIVNPQFEWTGGGLVTTARDLAQWGKLLYSGKVLSKEMMKQLLDTVSMDDGSRADYGYGLGVEVTKSKYGKIYGHRGTFPGYQALLKYYQDFDFSIAIQLNEDRTHNSSLKKLNRISDGFIPLIVKKLNKREEKIN